MNARRIQRETEIIDFLQPMGSEKNLYISNISVNLPEEEAPLFVQEEFHKAFSRFGLLYSILSFIGHQKGTSSPGKVNTAANNNVVTREIPTTASHEPHSCLYAFVNFYSKLSARRAKGYFNLTKIVGTTPCKVQFSKHKKIASKPKEPLYPNDCTNLANFYLGFDGWSTSIKLIKRDDPAATEGQDDRQSVCRFLCVVELVIPRHGLSTHGIGTAEALLGSDATIKGSILSRCRKTAHREALRNVFSRVLLVVVGGDGSGGGGGGKVHAEIDTTLPDPFITAECLQDPSMLTVNQLLEEPVEEGSDEDNDDDENLDDKMIHILADLQSDNTQPSISASVADAS